MSRLSCGLWFVLAACGGGGGFPDAPEPDSAGPTGTFSVTWSVIDQNSQPISCDRISAQAMTVLTHNLAVAGGATQIFSCNTGMGTSQGLAPGEYEMNFELAGTVGTLAMGAKQAPVTIAANANLELAPVTFQVEALGGVALKLATNKSFNCGAISATNAGITQMTIELNHDSDLTCEPVTLNISDGATQTGGTYMIKCNGPPMTRGCIENDQVITASGVPSDSYTIRVRGLVGANACYLNMDSIQVPPLNKLLFRTLNLGQQTQTPGC